MIAGTTSAAAGRAGLEALRQGGSAADAVLATSLAQITLAMGSWVSYAGILTMVYFDAGSGRFYNLNAGFNTVAGEDDPMTIPAQTNVLSPRPDAEIRPSGRTALVPGYMAGVQAAHKKFGKLPFKDLFAPAIYYADHGFELTPFHAGLVKLRQKVLSRLPETKAIFTKPDGSWVGEGDLFKQPALAATLRRIAARGADEMYTGEWGKRLVEAVRRDGGKMTLDDLKKYGSSGPIPWRSRTGDTRSTLPGCRPRAASMSPKRSTSPRGRPLRHGSLFRIGSGVLLAEPDHEPDGLELHAGENGLTVSWGGRRLYGGPRGRRSCQEGLVADVFRQVPADEGPGERGPRSTPMPSWPSTAGET